MRKIIAVLLVILFIGTTVSGYFWAKTNSSLSETRRELTATNSDLAESQSITRQLSTELTESLAQRDELYTNVIQGRAENEELSSELAESQARGEQLATELEVSREENKQFYLKLAELWMKTGQLSTELYDSESENSYLSATVTALEKRLWLIEKPEKKSEINSTDLRSFIKSKFPGVIFGILDDNYYLASKADWQRFLKADIANQKQYQKDFFDCDDYATWLLGAATMWAPEYVFGIMLIENESRTVAHAINFFVSLDENGNKKLWFVEPQNDRIYGSLEEMGYKFVTLIIV